MTWADVTNNAIDAAKIIVPTVIAFAGAVITLLFNHFAAHDSEIGKKRIALVEEAHDFLHKFIEAWGEALSLIQSVRNTRMMVPELNEKLKNSLEGISEIRHFNVHSLASRLRIQRMDSSAEYITRLHHWSVVVLEALQQAPNYLLPPTQHEIVCRELSQIRREAEHALTMAYSHAGGRTLREMLKDWTQGWRL